MFGKREIFDELLGVAAANSLVTGLRVGPFGGGCYQIHIWIGPRVGDRHEWYQRFDMATPHGEAINSVAERALTYCRAHWDCGRVADEGDDVTDRSPLRRPA
jgi:hypothetical protein